eukprot:TRINITY_DN11487_c0_g1_i5.p1 TRINITY_DN11487_c0_g1~~TRINITY_DN11487_c0_g1_i5.p1  ORF type:complete len:204 (+),score=44.34 TRINITY_DN11487_c0_g1_i5:127-738(+)
MLRSLVGSEMCIRDRSTGSMAGLSNSTATKVLTAASSRPSSHKKIYNPYIKFTAWRLGVNPESIARYGDKGIFSTVFRMFGIGATSILVIVSIMAEAKMNYRAQESTQIMDQNRKAFYGKDFHSPKDAAVQEHFEMPYGNSRTIMTYVDKKSGLMMDSGGKLIAPAAHERSLMLSEVDIQPQSLEKLSALRDNVLSREAKNKW